MADPDYERAMAARPKDPEQDRGSYYINKVGKNGKPILDSDGKPIQVFDNASFQKAIGVYPTKLQNWKDEFKDILGLHSATVTGGAQSQNYLNGPVHQMFSDYAAAPPAAGALFGYGLARSTIPRAPIGAGPTARLLGMVGPVAEAALGPGVDLIAHATQGSNPTERGKDITGAVGNAGWGEALGALAGGAQQMMLTSPATYANWRDKNALANLKPQIESIKQNSLAQAQPSSLPADSRPIAEDVRQAISDELDKRLPPPTPPAPPNVAPKDQRFIDAAREAGIDEPDPAKAKVALKSAIDAGEVSAAQKVRVRQILGMTKSQHTFSNALKSIAGPGLPFALTGAFMGADAARNAAKASGFEDELPHGAIPAAGALGGAAAGYGAYRGGSALLNALAEASPVAARMIGLGSRALPIAGNALLARELLNRAEASHQEGMTEDLDRARSNETYPLLSQGANLSELRQQQLAGENAVAPNALAMSGPNAAFYRALQEFKDHFSQQPQQ